METKRFDPNTKEFTTTSGMKYRVNTAFSILRYEQYEKLWPKLAYDLDFSALFQLDKKLYSLLNDRKFADAAVITHNRMTLIKDVLDSKREHPAMLMCALAILREGEDPATYIESEQIEKIADWRAEGFAIEDFFRFAASTMKGLPQAFNEFMMEEVNAKSIKIIQK